MNLPVPLRLLNETLAFLLKLAALVLLGWWGWRVGDGGVPGVLPAVLVVANTVLATLDRRAWDAY
nr:hypothetical protein KPHV_85360 [Kitasatospora purpeofusca]